MIDGACIGGVQWRPSGAGKFTATLPNGAQATMWRRDGMIAVASGMFGAIVPGASLIGVGQALSLLAAEHAA